MAVSSWHGEWCGDATVNTRVGLLNSTSLYEVHAIVNLKNDSTSEQGSSDDIARTVLITHDTCIGIKRTVLIFNKDFQEINHTLQFESDVISLHVSEHSRYLLVGEISGLMSLICLLTGNTIFCMNVSDQYNDDLVYCAVSFEPATPSNTVTIFVAATTKWVRFRLILNDSNQNEAAKDDNDESFHDYVMNDEMGQMMNCTFAALCRYANSSLLVVYDDDDDHIILIDDASLNAWAPSYIPMPDGVLQVQPTYDGKYLLVLDASYCLNVICTYTCTIINRCTELELLEFVLLETVDHANAVVDCKLIMVLGGEIHSLQICGFPNMNKLFEYTLQPTSFVKFVGAVVNEDTVHVVESKYGECKVLNILGIYETVPANKLLRLLSKKRIDEAENFANLFGLSNLGVAKARVGMILESLSSSDSYGNTTELCETLKKNLNQIEDIPYVVNICCKCPMPTLEHQKDILQYLIGRIMKNDGPVADAELAKTVFEKLKKLETYEMLFQTSSTIYSLAWEVFIDADLWKELLKNIMKGNLSTATLLLERHLLEQELCQNHIDVLLESIPETLLSHDLLPWLCHCVPLILRKVPDSFSSVVQWVIQKSCNMEINEKASWPRNAVQFFEGFIALCDQLLSDLGIDKCNIYFCFAQDSDSSLLIKKCREVLCNLKDLEILQTKYNCKISFGDYSESDKKIVAFRLLDWISPEMLETFIPQFLLQFGQKHNLDVNEIITGYIKDYMMNSEYCWWHWEEAPWEELMTRLVTCVNVDEMKCTAINEILKQAPVPWSDGIQKLLNTAMNLCSERYKVQLREEVCIMGLKTVILKYGFRNHSISDGINAQSFVNYILTKDQPSAVDDAMKVVAAHCHVHVHDLYVFRMKQLTRLKREADFVSLVKSFDQTMAQICCNRFIVYVVKLLNNEPDPVSEESREEQALFVNAAILILRRNHGLDCHISLLLDTFVKVKKLQAEFGIFLSVENYASEELRRELFRNNVASHLRNEEFTTNSTAQICQILTNKVMTVPKQVTGNLYRLGDILGFSCDEVSVEILQLAVKFQKFDTATETCRGIIQYFPSIGNATVLWNAIRDTLLAADQNLYDVNLSAALLCLMQAVLAYCNCDLIPECLELTVLMHHACVMQKHLTRAEFSLPVMPLEYFEWSYTDIFKEMGLSLDATSVFNFLFNSLQFYKEKDKQCANLLTATRIFCERLKQFGHSLLAFSTSCNTTACCALYAATTLTDEASCHVNVHLEAKYSHQTELVSEMICKIFTGQIADVHLAYALLCSLPQADAMNLLALQETRCSYNFNKLRALGSLGMQLSDALHMPTKVLYYRQLWKKAVWSAKLQKYNISFEDIDDDVALEDLMVQIGFVSPALIKSFCHCFSMDMNNALLKFLEVLLTSCRQDSETKMAALKEQMQAEDSCNVLIKMADLTISMMTVDQCQLHDRLCSILPNIDSYNYEFLEYVLITICSIGELANIARSCQVLQFLKVYQRISAPSQYEIHEWQNRYPSWQLTSLANSRLPFHPIMSENIWKVLKSELTADTISVWLGVSNIMTLPNDEMLMIAGQNLIDMVSKWMKPSKDYLDELTSIVARMENKEKALALINSMSTKFRPGNDKVQVAKLAVLFAFKWSEGTNDQAAKKALKRLTDQRLHFTTEHILHKYNLTNEKYLSSVQYPQKLIIRLYEDCPVGGGHFFCWSGNPDVHNACQEIGHHCKLDLRQIRFALAEKWLRNTESSKMMASAYVEPGLTQAANTVNDSLKRAVYIFKNGPIEESVQFLNGKTAINSPENTAYKVRALTCLLAIADPVTIQNMCGKTVDDLRAMFKLLVFAAEMERLHLPCAITYLDENHVTDILASLWRSHSHVNSAVSLMAQMLLHYKITTVKIWDVILPRLIEMKLWNMLIRVVVELSSCLDIIVLPSYKSAWKFVIFSPFDKVAEEQFDNYIKVFSALHMCPHSVQLDLHTLANSFVRAGLSSLALDCILHIGNEDARTNVFFDNVNARSVLDNWWKLKSSGVYIHHADKITEALYSWIDQNDQYASIADSHLYMEALAAYALDKSNIQNLVRFALQHNRCNDGIKLVRKYLEVNPQSKPAALAGMSELEILKAFAEQR